MKNKEKRKNFKRRARWQKTAGVATLAGGVGGGFITYEAITDWADFKTQMDEFIVIQEESLKLNLAIAIPMLVSILIFLFIIRKRNSEFFKNKVSMNILVAIVILYLFYSLAEVALASLIGGFAGAIFTEFLFDPLAAANRKRAEEQHDIDIEYEREKKRIKARAKAREELDGTV